MTKSATLASAPRSGLRLPLPSLNRLRRALDWQAAVQRRRLAPVRAQFYRDLWREAAASVGAECTQQRSGLTLISRNGLATFVRGSELMLDTELAKTVAGDRVMSFAMFQARGLPVPRHLAFSADTLIEAERFLAELGAPVVVKPLAGTGGGRGVTTGIETPQALRRAARYASGYGRALLVEEECSGASVRLTYLDGELIDVIRRDPPTVIGTGTETISALIAQENRRRRYGEQPVALSPLRIDDDMRNTLKRSGLGLGTRPDKGQRLAVKGAVNENASRENHNISGSVHADTIARLGALVTDMGVRFSGVDLIAQDTGRPLSEAGTVVSEINVNPGLHHHYLISDPARTTPLARIVLERMFDHRTGVVAL